MMDMARNPSGECIELSPPRNNETHDMNGLLRCPNRPQIRPRPPGEADSDGQNPDARHERSSRAPCTAPPTEARVFKGSLELAPTAIRPCCKLLPGALPAAPVKPPFSGMGVQL
jgi:hypothetical protein